MGTPLYDLPSPDDERDEDEERLSHDEWLAQYGSTRTAPVVSKPVPDIMRPQPAPSAPVTAPQRTPEPKQDVWSALATKNAPKPKLAPVATPSEQITTEAQKQQALGNPDKAARLVTQAAHQGAQENAAAGQQGARPVPELPTVGNSAVARSQRPVAQGGHGIDLGQPPEYQAPSAGNYWVALIADALLNNGRGAGRIVQGFTERPDAANVNYQRRVQHAKDVADIDATQRRGVLTPEEEFYKSERLRLAGENTKLRSDQIEAQRKALEAREKELYERTHPQASRAVAAREYLRGKGVDVSQFEGMGYESIKSAVQPALKNDLEIAMGEQMNALAADKAGAVAAATEDSKVRVATRTAEATQPYKVELARETAGIRSQEREGRDALEEQKSINAERRKRLVAQNRERTTLESIRERLAARAPNDSLPKQGHFIERGLINFKASALGGTGMNEDDSRLDNDLTMAGLQSYITGAGNAPNSEREQEVAGRKFRGDGTVAGSIAAIDQRLAEMDQAEEDLRSQEDATRMHQRSRTQPKRQPARQAAPATTSEGEGWRDLDEPEDDEDGWRDL